ncbi:MAG: hypothetical protein PHP44_03960 [Kiritimatiellae bacterium]|nr:hypothetical protein [Kiritimatiellia bacterium]MDD4735243.1 hypothetical protein [Kiritimatiellia bacterium]
MSVWIPCSGATGLPESFVTYYWQSFDEIYCPGCEKAGIDTVVFIDLYTPAFITREERRRIMISIADAIDKHTPFPKKDVYLHTHIAEKDQLFINGGIVTNWSQVGGPDDANGK